MANEQNLRPGEYKLTLDEQKKGGIASGKKRKELASLRKSFQNILNSDIRITKGTIFDTYKAMGIDISKYTLGELASMGLLFGAVNGNATNFKTMLETNNEVAEEGTITPNLKIEIIDNSNLEKTLYETNKHNKDDDRQQS